MKRLEEVLGELGTVKRTEILAWIESEWVRAETDAAGHHFRPVDVARLHLIRELRQDLEIGPEAMPVVLSLVDEMYTLRRPTMSGFKYARNAGRFYRRSIRKNMRRRRDDGDLLESVRRDMQEYMDNS